MLNHGGKDRYLTVPDHSMAAFRIIAKSYANNLPCFAMEEVDLEDGDTVQVVDGDFRGLVGTYVSKRGGRTGNIFISVTQKCAAVLYNISADYVRVLEFAKVSKRAYDQVEAFVPKLCKALRHYCSGEKMPSEVVAPLVIFCRRMECVRLDNPKIEAKLLALLMCASYILGNISDHENYKARFERCRNAITNIRTQALVALLTSIMYGDREAFKNGLEMLSADSEDLKPSASQAMLKGEYSYYSNLFKPT